MPKKTDSKTKKKVGKADKISKASKESKTSKEKYIEGIGRRKTAVARVRIYPAYKKEDSIINDRAYTEYFPLPRQQQTIYAPFKVTDVVLKMTVRVVGGGITAQAEAVRMGLARALVIHDETLRVKLKPHGYLTRDARMVESKKPGLRKARRPQQWRKR